MDVQESLGRAARIQAERDAADQQAAGQEPTSFDEFWAEVEHRAPAARRTETIRGVAVEVPGPERMTLRFRRMLDRLDIHGRETTEDEIRAVLGDMFGPDALDQWTDAGMTEQQLGVVMAWGIASMSGREITWAEAYEAVTTGKAPASLTARSRTSTGVSGSTGGRSRAGRSRAGGRRKR